MKKNDKVKEAVAEINAATELADKLVARSNDVMGNMCESCPSNKKNKGGCDGNRLPCFICSVAAVTAVIMMKGGEK